MTIVEDAVRTEQRLHQILRREGAAEILVALLEGPASAGELGDRFGRHRFAIDRVLTSMRRLGVVEACPKGTATRPGQVRLAQGWQLPARQVALLCGAQRSETRREWHLALAKSGVLSVLAAVRAGGAAGKTPAAVAEALGRDPHDRATMQAISSCLSRLYSVGVILRDWAQLGRPLYTVAPAWAEPVEQVVERIAA